MRSDLISKKALELELRKLHMKLKQQCEGDKANGVREAALCLQMAPSVEAVPVERLGKWGRLSIPYSGCPRGPAGRMGDGRLKEEALHWGVSVDKDELIEALAYDRQQYEKGYDDAMEK